jgi:hypothetical protein
MESMDFAIAISDAKEREMNTRSSPEAGNRRAGGMKTPAGPPGKKASDEFGKEGTNKTLPEPKADGESSEELGNTPHIGKTPYTRG